MIGRQEQGPRANYFKNLGTACIGDREMSFNHHSGPAWRPITGIRTLLIIGVTPINAFREIM